MLLGRGDHNVISRLAANAGAHFSEAGFDKLVDKAQDNDKLTELVDLRRDLPVKSAAPAFDYSKAEAYIRSREVAGTLSEDMAAEDRTEVSTR